MAQQRKIAGTSLKIYSCDLCTAVDNPHMMRCTQCSQKYHRKCAGVDSNVNRREWVCNNCSSRQISDAAIKPSTTHDSKSSPNNDVIVTQPENVAPKFTVTTATDTNTPTEQGLVVDNVTLEKSLFAQANLKSSAPLPAAASQAALQEQSNLPAVASQAALQEQSNLPASSLRSILTQIEEYRPPSRAKSVYSNASRSSSAAKYRLLEAEQILKEEADILRQRQELLNRRKQILERRDEIGSDSDSDDECLAEAFQDDRQNETTQRNQPHQLINRPQPSTQWLSNLPPPNREPAVANIEPQLTQQRRLTRNQIAARTSVGKELQKFTGKPEEWPLFLATYNQTTEICGFSPEENLLRLRKALDGPARQAVKNLLLHVQCVPQIIETLKMKFGRPELIIHVLLQQIRGMRPPTSDNLESIVNFALEVQNVCATMKASSLQSHLNNPELEQKLVGKLPSIFQAFWGMHKVTLTESNLEHFSQWLFQFAQGANTVIVPSTSHSERVRNSVNMHAEIAIEPKTGETNMGMPRGDKWKVVRTYKLCRRCLRPHSSSSCRSTTLCGIEQCMLKHHPLLHKANPHSANSVNTHMSESSAVLFRIVPITLYGNGTQISTYAFLDDGSSITLIDANLQRELGVCGRKQPLCLRWTGDTHRYEDDSEVCDIIISSPSGKRFTLKDVHSICNLDLPSQSLDVTTLKSEHKHFRNLPLRSYHNVKPKVLIGVNNSALLATTKSRIGALSEPVAEKTCIGWTIKGKLSKNVYTAHHHVFHICDCEGSACIELLDTLKAYICLDNLGVAAKPTVNMSKEDQLAQKQLDENTKYMGNHYETSLLWKYVEADVELPDSLPMAIRRALCLRNKMQKDPQLSKILQDKIIDYFHKGYIRKLLPEEEKFKTYWYLPIFPVTNPNKPGKVRLVWDAAAKVNGISLNAMLLKGPDQLTSLLSVLYRFRQRRVVIGGDIAEMFHQVGVRPEDQRFQRFLWYGPDDKEPTTYVMTVMTFGATCSPSCAQYIKNKNAERYRSQYPRAVQSIIGNHYVDDMLDSVDTEEDALNLAKTVQYIHANGGFLIRNWVSNSAKVLNGLEANLQDNINLDIENDMGTEKVLGMWWSTKEDILTFKLSKRMRDSAILCKSRRPTKREVLSLVMTIYDPLGLIGYYVMYAKVIMQEIWRSGCSWDDQIPDEVSTKWLRWIQNLPKMESLKIPRCYIQSTRVRYPELELHTFVDASEDGYAAVSYFRYCEKNVVTCTLVASKTRVSPMKMLTIPRLELQAAVLGTRLAKNISESHSVPVMKRYFWSDSRTVLSWINSDHRRYKQFVAYRISEILETTDTSDWRWVSSEDNVADEATKWKKIPDINSQTRWFIGPSFLQRDKEDWPTATTPLKVDTKEELRAQYVGVHHEKTLKVLTIIDPGRYSSWRRLLAMTAAVIYCARIWANRVKQRATSSILETSYTAPRTEDFQSAQVNLWRLAQLDAFKDELFSLMEDKYVEKTSSLYKLSPYLDNDKVVRLSSRLPSHGRYDVVILPKDHQITRLIIADFHEKYHHGNTEPVVNELRQQYWVPQLRTIVKKIQRQCQWCKVNKARPNPPRMGSVPSARLAAFHRPFSYVGVDYFGPLLVSIRRSHEKRYGVLFTCLTTRAIHIEIAHSLSTDSCIIAIRNFIARRGNPVEIWSDNGSNFKGAERELRSTFDLMDKNLIIKEFTGPTMSWKFIPPASSHMGGVWERLVRSVKNALYYTLNGRITNDELLRAALAEAEMVVNSRPLTYMPITHEEDEALTPYHFLIGGAIGSKPMSELLANGSTLRRGWQSSQQLANTFWRRWLKEYLPVITRRSKWFENVKPIEPGDIVFIVDPNNPRKCWPKGKVIHVRKSSDGQVRSATVKTVSGLYERPATKLAVIDVKDLVEPGQVTPGESVERAGNPFSRKL